MTHEPRILRVLDHIAQNPTEDLSLDALADVAAMSRFHWHRVFKGVTVETVTAVVRRSRLKHAAVQLVQSDVPVKEIAAGVGYPNAASFTRAFMGYYSLSPREFRRRGALPPEQNPYTRKSSPMSEVTIVSRPSLRLAAMGHTGPYPGVSGAFEKLSAVFAARNLFAHSRGVVGIFYDNPEEVPEAELRSHACFIVDEAFAMPEGLEEVRLPDGPHAVLLHHGPYATLSKSYNVLYGDWLPGSGHEPADAPSYELYLNSPQDTAPADLKTNLYLPLKA